MDVKDLAGLGKIAESIPSESYNMVANVTTDTFRKAVKPITAITEGLGNLLEQMFKNMCLYEQQLATLSILKAQNKVEKRQLKLQPPVHIKSFIKSVSEVSGELNEELHEMWVNVLAYQLTNESFHPDYIRILSSFSQKEACLLTSLKPLSEVGLHGSGYMADIALYTFQYFKLSNDDSERYPFDYSAYLLYSNQLAGVVPPARRDDERDKNTTLLFLSRFGRVFLDVVTSQE